MLRKTRAFSPLPSALKSKMYRRSLIGLSGSTTSICDLDSRLSSTKCRPISWPFVSVTVELTTLICRGAVSGRGRSADPKFSY